MFRMTSAELRPSVTFRPTSSSVVSESSWMYLRHTETPVTVGLPAAAPCSLLQAGQPHWLHLASTHTPESESSQVAQCEFVSLQQRPAHQLQAASVSNPLNLHPEGLLLAVPVPNQQVLLRHKGPSSLLYPQQVGEGLVSTQRIYHSLNVHHKIHLKLLSMTSDLWRLVVHRGDGDVEEQARDGAPVAVANGEGELDEKLLRTDVLHRRHERHFHVVHCMLGK